MPHAFISLPCRRSENATTPYKWNDTQVDVMLEDIESDETVKEKVITGFFKGIGVEGLNSGNVRIIDAGYDSVPGNNNKDDHTQFLNRRWFQGP